MNGKNKNKKKKRGKKQKQKTKKTKKKKKKEEGRYERSFIRKKKGRGVSQLCLGRENNTGL